MDFISILSIFVLACFVGYYVVWSVTPALHTPLMSVTNAISSVIVVGALIAAAAAGSPSSKWLGLAAVALASVIAENSPMAVREVLQLTKAAADRDDELLRRLESEAVARLLDSPDLIEGATAFVEKRAPVWRT